jgi:hypothetical protein
MFEQVFITGIYGSGKTTLAKRIAKETKRVFIGYDEIHIYSKDKCDFNKTMKKLKSFSNYVVDAIPISVDNKVIGWKKFKSWEAQNKCTIICCYCPSINEWVKRWAEKKYWAGHPSGQQVGEWKKHYKEFYDSNVTQLSKLNNNVKCWDSILNDYTTMTVMAERMS